MKFGVLKETKMNSALDGLSIIRPKSSKPVVSHAATLMLTSLVDAFSILVIYLLVNSANSKNYLQVDKPIHLPKAMMSQPIDGGVNVQIVKSNYYVNKKIVRLEDLESELTHIYKSLKKQGNDNFNKIIIQADQFSKYEMINPILILSSQIGFQHIKFATLYKKKKSRKGRS